MRKLDEEEKLEYGDSDDEEFRVSLPLKKNKPKRVRNYKNKMENWENAEVCNAGLSGVLCTASDKLSSASWSQLVTLLNYFSDSLEKRW